MQSWTPHFERFVEKLQEKVHKRDANAYVRCDIHANYAAIFIHGSDRTEEYTLIEDASKRVVCTGQYSFS